ncbi:MAG: hypothetical protein B7Z15_18330 [Rhizobiales bacterium 32-66-8]|nr:MAG: hypothetical protein B7Z15_18330 [Rhizobiales bacterium 32-66-8]
MAAYKGQPDAVLADVIPLRLNQPELAEQLIEANASRLAAIVLDPMPGRAGFIPPTPEFVSTIQAVAKKHGILIIGDEVLNFRQGFTGACARHGISPDLFTFGKIIGGGLPIGAIGGREDVMRVFDGSMGKPLVSQGGTFSANPLSMVAGFASMQALNHSAFAHLEELGDRLRGQLRASIERHNAPFSITGVASLFQIHAKATAPREFREAATSAAETNVMLEVTRNFANFGIIIPNRVTACLSTPMTQADIDLVAGAFEHFLVARSDLVDTLSQ